MSKRPADEEYSCSFFLERKKRHCHMKTAEGMKFCPHHSHLGTDTNPTKGARIPCPFDSSHFCYESKLQKHLHKCNAREKDKPEYFVENINAGTSCDVESAKVNLGDVSDEELLTLIGRIKSLYDAHHEDTTEVTGMHPFVKTEMESMDDGFNTFKHMKQQAALLSVLEENKLLDQGSCFVEFGAGKGQLMYWIIKCSPQSQEKTFILVDKSAQRHKIDNKFKDSDLQLQRLRIDIRHLCLGNVTTIQSQLDKVIGVSKHLCGAATDLAIRCLMDTLVTKKDEVTLRHKPFGLLMALCCHHRCSWSHYIGKEFMEKHCITEKDFQLMCCMASWATCGSRKTPIEKNENQKVENQSEKPEDLNLLNRYQKLNLKHEEREVIGLQCKRLIDAGRVHYARTSGYNTKLITYIDKSVSLENVALLAVNKES